MRNIVALVDPDDETSWRAALPAAIDYARHTRARLHVLTIVPDGMYRMTVVAQLIPEDFERRLIDDAKKRLSELVREQAGDDPSFELAVRMGSVHREALRYARDVDCDLIVMGAHRPELADYLLGANAGQIVQNAPCSVWVVRA